VVAFGYELPLFAALTLLFGLLLFQVTRLAVTFDLNLVLTLVHIILLFCSNENGLSRCRLEAV
jgi:hypothetical protein